MPITTTCTCGSTYSFKDEYAGNTVRCQKCNADIIVPGTLGTARPTSAPSFPQNKFLFNQKHFSISEKYTVWDQYGQPLLYIERPSHIFRSLLALFLGLCAAIACFIIPNFLEQWLPFKTIVASLVLAGPAFLIVTIRLFPKRHVTFYRDKNRQYPIFQVFQKQKFVLFNANYDVASMSGELLATLRKNYLFNFFRKRWYVHRPDGSLWAMAMEDSVLLSLLRRFLGSFFGLLRTNFIITRGQSEELLGEFNRKLTLLDRYVLDMSRDTGHELDRRVAMALGVMLDTGERR